MLLLNYYSFSISKVFSNDIFFYSISIESFKSLFSDAILFIFSLEFKFITELNQVITILELKLFFSFTTLQILSIYSSLYNLIK